MKGRAQMILIIKKTFVKIASIIAIVALLAKIMIFVNNKNLKSDTSSLNSKNSQSSSSLSTEESSLTQNNLTNNTCTSMDTSGMKNDISNKASPTNKCEGQLPKSDEDSLTEFINYVLGSKLYNSIHIESMCSSDTYSTLTDDSTSSQLYIKPLSQSSALIEYSPCNNLIEGIPNDLVISNKPSEPSNDQFLQDILYALPESKTESSTSSIMDILDEIENIQIIFDDLSIEQEYYDLISQININIQNMKNLKSALINIYNAKSINAPIIQAEISLCKSNIFQTHRMINHFKDNENEIVKLNSHLEELQKELEYLLLLQEDDKNNYICNNYIIHTYQCLHKDYRQQFLNILDRCIEICPTQSYMKLQQIYELYFNE